MREWFSPMACLGLCFGAWAIVLSDCVHANDAPATEIKEGATIAAPLPHKKPDRMATPDAAAATYEGNGTSANVVPAARPCAHIGCSGHTVLGIGF
jgi:hypothetical protein